MKRTILLILFLLAACGLSHAQPDEAGFIYDARGKRDPFSPLVDADGRYRSEEGLVYSADELKLSGILWDPEGKSSCLINNQIVKVGESIYGFMLKRITKDSVIITQGEEELVLRLSEEK